MATNPFKTSERSDQPPGYPRLYAIWFRVNETSILWARSSLTMVFTGLLLVSFYSLLRRYLNLCGIFLFAVDRV